jgi:hypothetical protein
MFMVCSVGDASLKYPPKWAVMADQIVITEKTSQAKDVRAAIGSHYGDVLPAEGHLFDLHRTGRRCSGLEAMVPDSSTA